MALGDIVQKEMKWMDESNCIGNTEPFDNYERGGAFAEEADALCLTCPVLKECFDRGQRGEWGQWGGVFWNGNGQPDLRANEHKSALYIEEIERAAS